MLLLIQTVFLIQFPHPKKNTNQFFLFFSTKTIEVVNYFFILVESF